MDTRRGGGVPHLSAVPAPGVTASFDPARLTLARERSGLTKRDLAARVGVTAAAITRFERGQARLADGTLTRLATELGLPVGYFAAGRPVLPVAEDAAHFRSLRTTRVYERRQARATMSHLAEAVREIQTVVRLPEPRLPRLSRDPESAARELRAAWRLPAGPVHHLVRLLEANGAVVSMARFGAGDRIDAFSCRPSGLDRPLICLSRDRGNPLRRRFSAAHELGHLLLHDEAQPGDRQHEHEANRFAAEFLTPAPQIADLLPTRLDFARLLEIQRAWGVSVQALLRRSRELDRIGDDLYRRAQVTLTRLGWRRDEPRGDYPTEWPAVLVEAVALGAERGLTEHSLAARLSLPYAEVRELLSHVTDDRPRLTLVPDLPD
ncbi:helix-turn-helix domain-containing protein [Actinoallomurus iriomotensis]|uniref:DNA-binding protein n=1 Tax=Actinoallomurus iriomotensis TaxID=478107 RepID=A0A9W6RR17_9ACTN|nr:XRE family transcriptional regulator [Actinoallomurus iriomotensis]GLY80193.1 DNA-binding protein [Actinoallomurus iriomotensis]